MSVYQLVAGQVCSRAQTAPKPTHNFVGWLKTLLLLWIFHFCEMLVNPSWFWASCMQYADCFLIFGLAQSGAYLVLAADSTEGFLLPQDQICKKLCNAWWSAV